MKQLGCGAFGVVYLAQDTVDDGNLVAVKCVPLSTSNLDDAKQAMSEVAILRNLQHPNVLQFVDYFIDAESTLCTVTEYIDGR